MVIKREVIAEGLLLNMTSDKGLCVTMHDSDAGRYPRFRYLSPEEVDKLVLSALSMTRPEVLDPNAAEDYQAAIDAVYVWQGTRAGRENARRLDAERAAVMKEAGYSSLTYAEAGPSIRFLVDQLIEARKDGKQ